MPERITAIEYIRGVAMLGVVGIHTGAYSLANPGVNIHLFALLEIFTRFSVPIFFFVTAFGLFLRHDLERSFDYRRYFARRCRTVVIPYLVWSVLYMLHQSATGSGPGQWSPGQVAECLLFGLASYQLYFLVILIWFYALMPLWRPLLRRVLEHPKRYLAIALILQIIFNYYSSYLVRADADNYVVRLFIQYRISYLPLHYLFIFLLGAVAALRFPAFVNYISTRRRGITLFCAVTLTGMLGSYYWLLAARAYTPVEAVNTVHQLSPIGVLYTLAASLFLMLLFTYHNPSGKTAAMLNSLSRYSYPVYLAHPFAMYYLVESFAGHGVEMTVPVVLSLYVATVTISLVFGMMLEKAASYTPALGLLLTGANSSARKASATA